MPATISSMLRHAVIALGAAAWLATYAHADSAAPPAASSTPNPAIATPSPSPPESSWEKIGDDDGITVYRREIAGSPVIAFKGDGVVNASIARVASVLVDASRATEWVDSLVEARTLRHLSETEYVEYDHIGTPFVMKDRDFVVDCKLDFDPPKKKVVLHFHSVDDSLAPKTSFIRGELISSAFTLTALDHGSKTHIEAEVHCDPKGSVAKWIVNLFQKSWPHNTITSLRKQVAKPNIVEDARLKEALTEKGYLH